MLLCVAKQLLCSTPEADASPCWWKQVTGYFGPASLRNWKLFNIEVCVLKWWTGLPSVIFTFNCGKSLGLTGLQVGRATWWGAREQQMLCGASQDAATEPCYKPPAACALLIFSSLLAAPCCPFATFILAIAIPFPIYSRSSIAAAQL